MSYINTTTGAYPLSAADVRAALPNTSFPGEVAGFEAAIIEMGYALVQQVTPPAVAHTKNITEGAPVQANGAYQQKWLVSDATTQQVTQRTADQAINVRQERDQRLSDSDATVLPDAKTNRSAWGIYREALRQVPEQPGFPWEIEWPVQPDPSAQDPDYLVFWDALMMSTVYAAIREQSFVSLPMNTLATEFIALIGDAKAGRPNETAIQASITAILSTGTFTYAQLTELSEALVASNLDEIYPLA